MSGLPKDRWPNLKEVVTEILNLYEEESTSRKEEIISLDRQISKLAKEVRELQRLFDLHIDKEG